MLARFRLGVPDRAPTSFAGKWRGGAGTGFGHVDVRVGAKARHRLRERQHAARDVGMQVQAGDHRHPRADDGAQPRQQLAFGVVGVFGDGGAVQVEVDGVEAAALRVFHQHGEIGRAHV